MRKIILLMILSIVLINTTFAEKCSHYDERNVALKDLMNKIEYERIGLKDKIYRKYA